jgi:SAM-dependent methyltransferase
MGDRVEIRQGDMMALPYDDGRFDAVIAESVIAFAADKGQALSEFVRVTRPGGYVGFTEATWMSEPKPELLARLPDLLGENFETYDLAAWRARVEAAGLEEVVAEAHPIDIGREARGRIERIGCGNMLGVLGNFGRMLFKRPSILRYMSAVQEPKDIVSTWDYGIYVGRKPAVTPAASPLDAT